MREKIKPGSSASNQHHNPRHQSDAILDRSAQGSLQLHATRIYPAGTTRVETRHPPGPRPNSRPTKWRLIKMDLGVSRSILG